MAKVGSRLYLFFMVIVVMMVSILLTACGGTGDGIYSHNGLIIEVKNHIASVVAVEPDVEEVIVPVAFNELEISDIKEDAFASSSLKKISFEESGYDVISIYPNAFNDSSVEVIENLPANVELNRDSFAGLQYLKSMTVFGEGELSIENGALIKNDEYGKTLILLPAGSQPQENFEDGVYTITGYASIQSNALSYNQYITDIVIAEDIARLNSDICTHVKLDSVTIQTTEYFDLFISNDAFTIHKDLKVYVPATTDSEMNSWLHYSSNFVYDYNWLVHPVSCHESGAHLHGIRNSLIYGSLKGYSYNEGDTVINIDVGDYTSTGVVVPDYMFEEYQG